MKFKATLNESHKNLYFHLYKAFRSDNKVMAFLMDHFLMSARGAQEAMQDLEREEHALVPPPAADEQPAAEGV